MLSVILVFLIKNQNLYFTILRFFIFFEYTFFALYFYFLLKNYYVKKILIFSIGIFLVFCGYRYFDSKIIGFDSTTFIVEFVIFIIVILYYFYEKIKIVTNYHTYKSISFWLSVGIFIYFTGNFFFLLFVKSSKDPIFIKQMKIIYSIVTITKNIILSLAWLAQERQESDADILQIPDGVQLDEDFIVSKQNNV